MVNQKKRIDELSENIKSEDNNPETQYAQTEMQECIQEALLDIHLDYRILIILKHLQFVPYRDIAYILDIPEKKSEIPFVYCQAAFASRLG